MNLTFAERTLAVINVDQISETLEVKLNELIVSGVIKNENDVISFLEENNIEFESFTSDESDDICTNEKYQEIYTFGKELSNDNRHLSKPKVFIEQTESGVTVSSNMKPSDIEIFTRRNDDYVSGWDLVTPYPTNYSKPNFTLFCNLDAEEKKKIGLDGFKFLIKKSGTKSVFRIPGTKALPYYFWNTPVKIGPKSIKRCKPSEANAFAVYCKSEYGESIVDDHLIDVYSQESATFITDSLNEELIFDVLEIHNDGDVEDYPQERDKENPRHRWERKLNEFYLRYMWFFQPKQMTVQIFYRDGANYKTIMPVTIEEEFIPKALSHFSCGSDVEAEDIGVDMGIVLEKHHQDDETDPSDWDEFDHNLLEIQQILSFGDFETVIKDR